MKNKIGNSKVTNTKTTDSCNNSFFVPHQRFTGMPSLGTVEEGTKSELLLLKNKNRPFRTFVFSYNNLKCSSWTNCGNYCIFWLVLLINRRLFVFLKIVLTDKTRFMNQSILLWGVWKIISWQVCVIRFSVILILLSFAEIYQFAF